jgi:hypothetical protein
MGGVVAIGAKRVWGVQSIVSFTLEVIFLDIFNEIIETALVVFACLFFACLSMHITTITSNLDYNSKGNSKMGKLLMYI